jgi:hypothetical protein
VTTTDGNGDVLTYITTPVNLAFGLAVDRAIDMLRIELERAFLKIGTF